MKLSVIVCTRDRAHAIIGCLDSIAISLSNAAPVEAEIVVVDNGSTDNTSDMIKEWAKSCIFPVNLVYEPRKGLAVARNCGIHTAQGELLVFTDDDCRLSKDYVTDALRYDTSDSTMVLRGGRVELGDQTDLPLSIKILTTLSRKQRQHRSAKYENLGNAIVGCNMVMRRTTAEHIGPFDELFGAGSNIPGGEDTDYIFRAYLADIPIEYVPDMTVFHFHGRKSVADGNKLFQNYMIGTGALYAKYIFKDPNLCRQFYWDAKNSVSDIISGQNTCLTNINFSHKDKVFYCLVGIKRYLLQTLSSYFQRKSDRSF